MLILFLLLRISNVSLRKYVFNILVGLEDTSIGQHGQAVTGANPQYHLCPFLVGRENKFLPVIGIEEQRSLAGLLLVAGHFVRHLHRHYNFLLFITKQKDAIRRGVCQ